MNMDKYEAESERLTPHATGNDEPEKWTVDRIDELLDLKFELSPVNLKLSEYFEKLRLLAFKINAAIERAKGAEREKVANEFLDWHPAKELLAERQRRV